ncbi:MAG: hypothetical protein AAGJ52_10500 [Pseudomonadota bacterium]
MAWSSETSFDRMQIEEQLLGFWAGGVVRQGSILRLEIEIRRGESGLEATRNFLDWLGYARFRRFP